MLPKLALRNTRKNIGDFAVYFLTLMFGVAMVYAFGSIPAQKAMLRVMEQADTTSPAMSGIMTGLSVFVAFILGFLVLYANGFLMKRRGREFGTYLLLGLPKRKVAVVLAMETLLVGVLALASGLVLGVFASQGMSLLSVRLFEVKMDEYAFVFSAAAAVKTIVLFGVLFVAVAVLNTVTIGRRSVVTLLGLARRNQEPRVRSRSLSLLLLVAGAVMVTGSLDAALSTGLITSERAGTLPGRSSSWRWGRSSCSRARRGSCPGCSERTAEGTCVGSIRSCCARSPARSARRI